MIKYNRPNLKKASQKETIERLREDELNHFYIDIVRAKILIERGVAVYRLPISAFKAEYFREIRRPVYSEDNGFFVLFVYFPYKMLERE